MQKEREQNTIDETEGMQICDKKAQKTQIKKHKKTRIYTNYLHMSKKSSTFAR